MVERKRRAAAGHTMEPYECCGAKPGMWGRQKATICDDCRSLIEEGQRARHRQKTDQQAGVAAIFNWATQPHWWPQYYGQYNFSHGPDAMRQLANAMYALVNLVAVPAPADTPRAKERGRTHRDRDTPWPYFIEPGKDSHTGYDHSELVQAPPLLRDAIDQLDTAIRAALTDTHQEGKRQGSSLLFSLAAGEKTFADFNEAVQPPEARKKRSSY